MNLFKPLAFTAKLAAKATLVAGGVGVTLLNEAAKTAISKGVEPKGNYDSEKCSGLANTLFDLNKKIKL